MTTAQTDGFAAYQTWLGTPLPGDPIVAMRALRREAAREIERLLAFLDATDGDPDLEDDGGGIGDQDGLIEQTAGEPSLGWPASSAGPHAIDRYSAFDVDTELDEADEEPSLASPEGASCPAQNWTDYVTMPHSQAGWARGNSNDLEGDPREDDEDGHDAEDDKSDCEPDSDSESYLANSTSETEEAVAPSKEYTAALRQRRGPTAGLPVGFANVDMSKAMPVVNGWPKRSWPLDGQGFTVVSEVGDEMRIGPDGRIIR